MQTEYVNGKRRSECANIRPGRAAKKLPYNQPWYRRIPQSG